MTRSVLHVVHGEQTPSASGRFIELRSPVTGAVSGSIAAGTDVDAENAVASSERAFPEWSETDPADRGRVLWDLADALMDNQERLAEEDCVDAGKPLLDCIEDVTAAAKLLRFYAGLPDKIRGSTMQVQSGYSAWTLREPYGVVAAIVPWNYPIYNACAKVGGIIAMGNTCVLKPAEQAPTSAVSLGMLAIDAGLPRGVLNILNGDSEAGAALSSHRRIQKLSFTGSTATGRLILKAAAESNLKSCTMELGGKSPCIVFADADLDVAAEAAAFSNFYNQGQTCTAATRILVERPVYEEFVQKLVARAKALKVGEPRDEATQIGPLVSKEQFDKVIAYIAEGKSQGDLLCGGERIGESGYFITPTVIGNVDPMSTVAREEIFGPVASVMPFDTQDEAVELANSVDYGLAASIWTSDVTRMHQLAQRVQSGIVWGNCLFAEHPSVPVGGYGESGFGLEYGIEAGFEYTRQKSVWLNLTNDTLRWTGVDF